ncbi:MULTISPECIES: hypothetical protein [unclassified Meiothermus]|uniref:hypothetical protein n=1 Tax=unclassified Meiothermus TaxID=370471 RepID=UPI001314CCB6|nr:MULTISPECIES: hypothetical protein [unclassified Meiothermus]
MSPLSQPLAVGQIEFIGEFVQHLPLSFPIKADSGVGKRTWPPLGDGQWNEALQ